MQKLRETLVNEEMHLRFNILMQQAELEKIKARVDDELLYSTRTMDDDFYTGLMEKHRQSFEQKDFKLQLARSKYKMFKDFIHGNMSKEGRQAYLERVSQSQKVEPSANLDKDTIYLPDITNPYLKGKEGEFAISVCGEEIVCPSQMTAEEYKELYTKGIFRGLMQSVSNEISNMTEEEEAQLGTVKEAIEDACDFVDREKISETIPTSEERENAIQELQLNRNIQQNSDSEVVYEESLLEQ